LEGVAKYPALHWKSAQRLREGLGLRMYLPLGRSGQAVSTEHSDLYVPSEAL
jgi:hypothetical protein